MMPRSRKVSARTSTPPSVKTVSVSEFVRGGIYDITEPTVVMSHSTELGTWYPRGQGMTSVYYSASSGLPTVYGNTMNAPTTTADVTDSLAAAIRPVVEQMLANVPKVDVTPALPNQQPTAHARERRTK